MVERISAITEPKGDTGSSMKKGRLTIDDGLFAFVVGEAVPGTGLDADAFWSGLAAMLADLMPRNMALLETSRPPPGADRPMACRAFRQADRPQGLSRLSGRDRVHNARYALNAANARWGSLYDALYGTDAVPMEGGRPPAGFCAERARAVVARAKAFLDEVAPLQTGKHAEATAYRVEGASLVVGHRGRRARPGLRDADRFVARRGPPSSPESILLRHNGLHIEIRFDRSSRNGRSDPAGVSDIVIESALTTIMDMEDSVAAVDAADKVGSIATGSA